MKLVEAEKRWAKEKELAEHRGMRLGRFQEGQKVVDVEMKRLLQEGFDLRDEIERLKSGKVARGVDKGTRMAAEALRPGFCLAGVQTDRVGVCTIGVVTDVAGVCLAGVQTDGVGVSTVGVMTDVTNVQVVQRTTYASVAS